MENKKIFCRDCEKEIHPPRSVTCPGCALIRRKAGVKKSTAAWRARGVASGKQCSRCHKPVTQRCVCQPCRSYVSEWKRRVKYREPNKPKRKPDAVLSGQTAAILARQGGRCVICCTADGPWHLDHIVPRCLGGADDKSNFQVLCAPCNLRKGRKDPIQFAREIGRLL